MTKFRIDQQVHGYRNGHQRLATTIKLSRDDQDTVDRLSDISGHLRPGEAFKPYLTMYPLPERTHYVLARTWQDLTAPRAGCVITRSLFIPMPLWAIDGHLRRFVDIMQNAQVDVVALEEAVDEIIDAGIPPVTDPRTIELVEAVFLEVRKPVVVFDANEPENTALRLLTAAWPSLRQTFSVCTWALAPRRISGRDFDLVFAPKSARTRFGDWSGRRIDVSSPDASRHRWANSTAHHIFRDKSPSLMSIDALGVLKEDQRGDESTLRLSLLWNELTAKASSNPTAILGLLDILNSQGTNDSDRYDVLSPYLRDALRASLDTLDDDDAWRFLVTLTEKFPEQLPAHAAYAVERAAAELSARDTAATVRFLLKQSVESRGLPKVILSGMADGLASSTSDSNESALELPPNFLSQLLSASEAFTKRILNLAEHRPSSWIAALLFAISDADKDVRRKIRVNALPSINHVVFQPLLAPLLEGISSRELVEAVVAIGNTTQFKIPEFDEPLANAARDEESVLELRRAILVGYNTENADRLILATLAFEPRDILWLLDEAPPDRADRLLVRLLQSTQDRSLIAAQRDQTLRDRVLQHLSHGLPRSAEQLVRVLTLSGVEIQNLLRIGARVREFLPPLQQNEFAAFLLTRGLVEAKPDDNLMPTLLETAALDPRRLIHLATSEEATPARLSANLVMFAAASPDFRRGLSSKMDLLSERLTRRDGPQLSEQGYIAWAELISQAADQPSQFRAASMALTFAFRKPEWPVSSLIIASFPIVYSELLRSKEGDERTVPAFFVLPMSFFVDWDRAKSARHDLVDAFKSSIWPPAHLLITAERSNILAETVERLARSPSGRAYLNELPNSYKFLSPAGQKRVQTAVRKYI